MVSDNSKVRMLWALELTSTLLLIIVLLGVGGSLMWDRFHLNRRELTGRDLEADLPKGPVSLDGAAVSGDPRAQTVIIEYSDFFCPFCGGWARDVLPDLDRLYVQTGKVRLAFRHLPLPIHPLSRQTAVAIECARFQGAFWKLHDWAFRHQDELDEPHLDKQASAIGLNMSEFNTCLSGDTAAANVQRDIDSARGFKITGTPTFFVGTAQTDGTVSVRWRLSGARPAADFQRLLDASLRIPQVSKAR